MAALLMMNVVLLDFHIQTYEGRLISVTQQIKELVILTDLKVQSHYIAYDRIPQKKVMLFVLFCFYIHVNCCF